MASRTLSFGLDRLMSEGTLVGLDDGELLDRFFLRNDQRAFAILVQRHGPLVWCLCNSILQSPHDADDAFQATFLILAKRAGEIERPERLSCWLHGVALKVAKKARSRRKTSTTLSDQAASDPEVESELNRREEIAILHTELERIPAKYRTPIILCHLEGLTHEAAAAQLGWPVGTVRGRLARGRDNLRERLMRRGLSMPMLLNPMNYQGMLTSRAYQALTGLDTSIKTVEASRTVLQLTQGVLMMMSFAKFLNLGLATTIGAGLIILAAGWAQVPAQGQGKGDSPAIVKRQDQPEDQPTPKIEVAEKTPKALGTNEELSREIAIKEAETSLDEVELAALLELYGKTFSEHQLAKSKLTKRDRTESQRIQAARGKLSSDLEKNRMASESRFRKDVEELTQEIITLKSNISKNKGLIHNMTSELDKKNRKSRGNLQRENAGDENQAQFEKQQEEVSKIRLEIKKDFELRKQEDLAQAKLREEEISKLIQESARLAREISAAQTEIELEEWEIDQLKSTYESSSAMDATDLRVVESSKESADKADELRKKRSLVKESIFRKSDDLIEKNRRLEELKESLYKLPSPTLLKAGKPHRVQIGDTLVVEVLEALPGRPISGERIVRSDGTISLGFYGDLRVVGMTRDQIKVTVVDQLTRYLNEDVLGLIEFDEENKPRKVAPIDTDRIFVDDSQVDYERKMSESGKRNVQGRTKAATAERP